METKVSNFKEHIVQILVALISGMAAVWAVYIQVSDTQRTNEIDKMFAEVKLYQSQDELQEIQKKLMLIVEDKLTLSDEELTKLSIVNELKGLEEKLVKVSDQTLALRQAINPLKPDEVLTIARLTDEVKALKADYSNLEKSMKEKHTEFSNSILRELKSSNDATNLILVVLIPLLLNFLYTIWKDFKTERREEPSNNQSQSDS